MALLRDVRSLFRRRRPMVRLDLSDDAITPSDDAQSAREDDHSPRILTVRPGTEPMDRRPPERSARGGEEILGLVHRVAEHLDRQAGRTDRLLEVLHPLPAKLEALPELHRQSVCLLEALQDNFDQARQRESGLTTTLTALREASDRQSDVLGLIHQQLDATRQATEHRTDAMMQLDDAISAMVAANERTGETLSRLVDSSDRRQSQLAESLTRSHRWSILALACCGGAALVCAIALMIIALTR